MKKGNFLLGALTVSLCLIVACSKTKDDKPVDPVDPPVNNNPSPNDPKDSTPNLPTFTDFSPVTAFIGDTITLTGTNLGTNIDALNVTFGSVSAAVVSASNTSAKVIVPNDIEQAISKIQLTINSTAISSDKNFSLKAPVIESLSYTKGFPGQGIEIKGRGFRNSYKFNQVTFGTKSIDKGTVRPGNTVLFMHAPDRIPAGTYAISVTVAGMTVTAADSFTVITPSIQSISPDSAHAYTEVTIKGNNLKDNNGGRTSVFLSDWKTGSNSRAVYVRELSDNQVKFQLTDLPAGTYKVSVMVLSGTADYSQPFTCKELN